MLNNPDWYQGVLDWLRQQPADGTYQWQHPMHCLIGQFLAATGQVREAIDYTEMPDYRRITETKPWTFGAALRRAETAQR